MKLLRKNYKRFIDKISLLYKAEKHVNSSTYLVEKIVE